MIKNFELHENVFSICFLWQWLSKDICGLELGKVVWDQGSISLDLKSFI